MSYFDILCHEDGSPLSTKEVDEIIKEGHEMIGKYMEENLR